MENLRIAVILGANRNGRTGPAVSRWFVDLVRSRPDLDVDVLDVADLPLTERHGHGHGAPVADFGPRVAAADGFVVVTPEYNHGYPGPLKSAIDSARGEWFGKAAGFVSYGGMSGGLRAIEQLRTVFSELHVATIRDTVSLHNASALFGEDGLPRPEMAGAGAAAGLLLDELAWWALALREARRSRPYPV
ncbi:NADPH-dependent FMN reductase [Nocardiopsis flavescens]|uniref:NAD(P)H-dependent FMN reductase n=1 Tax=Nocardiopsis flavescens TaxID=758803 RepID=A0A1M6RCG7_9ACTN|nr:NAD(P)H-dependent oxidoreductase [Nocardiopsis flavescens]SHK30126.1 NAD(P)H-dependent FMN reductase [Nocardiopsis flavescens]